MGVIICAGLLICSIIALIIIYRVGNSQRKRSYGNFMPAGAVLAMISTGVLIVVFLIATIVMPVDQYSIVVSIETSYPIVCNMIEEQTALLSGADAAFTEGLEGIEIKKVLAESIAKKADLKRRAAYINSNIMWLFKVDESIFEGGQDG